MADEHSTYHPVDTLANTATTTLQTGVAGAILAGVQNSLRKQNVGAWGILTRSGHIIGIYAAVGAGYQFTRDATANLRQKNDIYNEAIGGFVGGTVVGLARRSMPFTLGAGVCFATAMSAFTYTKGIQLGFGQEVDEDAVERKEAYKKERRRPLSDTIAELGEGRGIYAPGYEERRRQRLLERYGIDVGEAQGQK